MLRISRRFLVATGVLLTVLAPAAGAATVTGQIGIAQRVTGNGRALHPIGSLTGVGNFPTGSALTPDGRFLWVLDSGHGKDDVQIVDVASGKVVQTLALPGAYGGIAITPDGSRAFASGAPATGDPMVDPAGAKGTGGDVLHVFDIDRASGKGTEVDPVALPSSSGGSGQLNSLPPVTKLYPFGLAISPDGRTVAVALQQADKVAFASTAGGAARTVSVGRYPNSVAFDHQGRAYVSNAYDGTLSVVDPGSDKVVKTIDGLGGVNSQPEGMAMDPRTDRLYVAVTQNDQVGVVDTRTLQVSKRIDVGRPDILGAQPTALAVDPDGSTLWVANSNVDELVGLALTDRPASAARATPRQRYRPPGVSQLQAYATAAAAEAKRFAKEQKAARGSAAKKRAARAHDRRVAQLHAVLLKTARTQACAGPTKLQARRFRQAVLAALRGRSSKRAAALRSAMRGLPTIVRCAAAGATPGLKAYEVAGKLPTAAYPTSVQITPNGAQLLWVAGKGFGSGANPDFLFDGAKTAFGKVATPYGSYVLDKLQGIVGRLALPTDKQAASMTKAADAQAVPANAAAAPADTPVRADGPIKHVFYIVRENRTYDQVFGSDPRGDGDASLELFDDNGVSGPTGGITPNAHALTRTFPLLDHFYADSEVSVDGHVITAGSLANDYDQKAVPQNYSRPGKSFDFGIYPITFGPNGFVFDQAVRQGVTFRNYGEGAAASLPLSAGRPTYPQVQAGSDFSYPSNLQIGCTAPGGPGANLAGCTQDSGSLGRNGTVTAVNSRVNSFLPQLQAQVASGTVPAFNYLILPNDHTNGTTKNAYSPQALIADNDLGLGQLVDAISHSSIWASSAIFVMEDDSQDGADHVDAHRMPAFVMSPYAKRGAVVHTRYDQYSMLRTAELIAGLKPLSSNDGLATPMYDAFQAAPDVEGTRYTAVRPTQSLTEINGASAPLGTLSSSLPLNRLDVIPQALLDRILWASVHGEGSTAPQPGPNASPEEHDRAIAALRRLARTGDARQWLVDHTDDDEDEGEDAAPLSRYRALSEPTRASAAAEARRLLEEMRP